MRTLVASLVLATLVVGAVVGGVIAFDHPRPPSGSPAGAVADVPIDAVAARSSGTGASTGSARMPGAAPATPVHGAPVVGRRPIYRCRAGSATSYSNQPCPDGTLVRDDDASGFDSRPSERLASLVAAGRRDDAAPVAPSPSVAMPATAAGTSDCSVMRRQIRDIDETARLPLSSVQQDALRANRQDIRTSMARLHC